MPEGASQVEGRQPRGQPRAAKQPHEPIVARSSNSLRNPDSVEFAVKSCSSSVLANYFMKRCGGQTKHGRCCQVYTASTLYEYGSGIWFFIPLLLFMSLYYFIIPSLLGASLTVLLFLLTLYRCCPCSPAHFLIYCRLFWSLRSCCPRGFFLRWWGKNSSTSYYHNNLFSVWHEQHKPADTGFCLLCSCMAWSHWVTRGANSQDSHPAYRVMYKSW